ncbi:IS66 family insertion sequence element accessory protein TnpB [Mesorhizobium sp. M1005]|uniref:IS66 family insertion sequence element accessory protein TnpB n=1 Tax=unclassified Mesorhizobium TaxID=325217 RepID=UPI00333BBF19
MEVDLDVPTAGYAGRLEVLEGPTGRRVRSEAEKARIAAESLMPGVQGRRSHASMRDPLAGLLAASPSAGTTGTAGKHGADVRAVDGGRLIGASAEDEAIEIDAGEGGDRDRRHGDPNGGLPRAAVASDPSGSGLAMIAPGNDLKIYVATRPVVFRRGMDGLALAVQEMLGLDPFCGAAFVFRAKRADRIKILVWDRTGLVLVHKRLEGSKFVWPQVRDGVMRMSPAMFAALFDHAC